MPIFIKTNILLRQILGSHCADCRLPSFSMMQTAW